MNINELTIGQTKELLNIFSGHVQQAPNLFGQFYGRYAIARTRNAGVIFGKVVEAGAGYLHMVEARRIYKPISKDKSLSWYEGVASSGLCENKGVISGAVERVISEDFELTLCSDVATKSLMEFSTNETTY